MFCYNHPTDNVVSSCMMCSKGLCSNCTDKYSKPLCNACALEAAALSQRILIRNIMLTFLFIIIGILLAINFKMPASSLPVFLYIAAGIPWGWSALNRITPNIFLSMPLIGWLIYFALKFTLSYFVGLVALPWQIYKSTMDWKRIKGLKLTAKGC